MPLNNETNENRKRESIDHDLLVTLNVKVDRMATDMKEIKDGSTVQLADHEKRLESLEAINVRYPADILVPQFVSLQQEIHDNKTTAVVWRTVAGAGGGAIFFVLSNLPKWIEFWMKK